MLVSSSPPSEAGLPERPHPVLAGESIICLAYLPWRGPWKAYHQLMWRLAETNRVLCVDPAPPLRRALAGIWAGERRPPTLERVTPSFYLYNGSPLLGRSRSSTLFNWASTRARSAHVRRAARRLGFESPILWMFDPMLVRVVGTFREKRVIYHVVDNYVQYLPASAVARRAAVARSEEMMLQRADVVFAVSEALHTRCLARNLNSHLVPNGVDYDRFQTAMLSAWTPPDLTSIPKPIVGYVGVIQTTLDFSLLRGLADRRPDWSFVFVGPQELGPRKAEFDALLARPNVYCLDRKPLEDVPHYIKCFDVCIMLDDERAEGDAIKVYEYLACGRPVVSKDNPSIRRFMPLVQVAATVDDFEQGIDRALAERGESARARAALAREHTWQRRLEAISVAIRRSLPGGVSLPDPREAS